MKAFLQAVVDAFLNVFREPASRSTMVLAIIIYSILYPMPYVAEVVRDIPVAVIDQDGTTMSRELIRRIDAADTARVEILADELTQAKDLFYRRHVDGIVIIPPNFQRDLLNGGIAPVAAFGDAGYFMLYSAMMGAVGSAASSIGTEVQITRLTNSGVDPEVAGLVASPMATSSVALFNPQGGYASYVIPPAFALILQQTLLMGIGILHAGRKPPEGIALFAAPLAYLLLYCLWIGLTQIILPLAYDVPRLSAWWQVFAVAIPFLMAVIAMGFAIAQIIPKSESVVFTLVVLGLPLFFLSGISWPVESIPRPIHEISRIIPSTTALKAFVEVNQMGGGIRSVKDTLVLQLALAVGYTALGLLVYKLRAKAEERRAA